MNGTSGICHYSREFYRLILEEKGYTFIDSAGSTPSILSAIGSRDHVHIELGIFQKKEIELLQIMLKANYQHVTVTLHDAPILKYPYYEFKYPLLNQLSKLYDKYGNNFKLASGYIKKIRSIYVLSKKGVTSVKDKYKVNNVYYLPHVIDPAEPDTQAYNSNFIYFGFIGKNKGIEYSLRLHQLLMEKQPCANFYVVGKPLGKEVEFYNYLKKKYKTNVHFLGFVPEDQLNKIFELATFAIIPFREYRFFSPVSGSVLYSLKKGKIVLTSKVNTIPEIIEDGKNGFYLSGNLKKDAEAIETLVKNKALLDAVRSTAYGYLIKHHSPVQVRKYFNE